MYIILIPEDLIVIFNSSILLFLYFRKYFSRYISSFVIYRNTLRCNKAEKVTMIEFYCQKNIC